MDTYNVDLHGDGLYWSRLGRDPISADANDGRRVSRGLGIQEKGNKGRPVTQSCRHGGATLRQTTPPAKMAVICLDQIGRAVTELVR